MADAPDPTDPLAARIAATRPDTDVIARVLMAKVRTALVDAEPEAPTIGRFVIERRLGAGGMGVVYAAHDPTLARPVALKVVRGTGDAARARMLREARALARLAHDHVVGIYDADVVGDAMYIAMERVDGVSLRAHLAAARRPVRDIVRLFAAAGRGLAAAHGAGVIHGDFKPENALVTADGRVKVVDFGLARAADPVAIVDLDPFAGTPAYMAPEQFRGGPIDHATDQFALCVALWEAVHGERPFAGGTVTELAAEVRTGTLREPPRDRAAPVWLMRILRRGLRVDPAQRFPSMAALVAALTRPERARRWWLAGGAAAGLVAVGAAVALAITPGASGDRCGAGPARLAAVWNPARAAAVRTAFGATGRHNAGSVADRVIAGLDGYGTAWTRMHRAACEATHVRGEQSGTVLDLRMACLDRRLAEVRAIVDALTTRADADAIDHAPEAVYGLTTVAGCADVAALSAAIPPPEDAAVRARVDALRGRLDASAAQRRLGHVDTALVAARAADAEAAAIAYAPIRADAAFEVAESLGDSEDWPGSEAALRRGIAAATEAHDDALVARGWAELIFTIGYGEARPDDALALAEPAGLALTRAGGDDAQRAELAAHLASTLQSAGNYDGAMALYEEALALREAVLAPGDPVIGLTRMNVGTIELARGDTAAARATFERARDALATALGPDHPLVGKALNNIAVTYDYDGNYPEAERVHREALALRVAVLGEAHPDTAGSLLNLGGIREAEGEVDDADAMYRRALAAFRAAYQDADHPDIALTMNNLGGLALNRGALAEAHEMLEGALAMFTRLYGADHPDVAMVTGTLGNLARRENRLADAIALHERALAIDAAALGPDHPTTASDEYNLGETLRIAERCGDARPHLDRALAAFTAGEDPAMPAYPLTAIGMCAVTGRHFAAAIEPLERAVELRVAAGTAEPAVADARFALAEALWGAGRDRARARALAEAARAGYVAVGDGVTDELAELDAWLAKHR